MKTIVTLSFILFIHYAAFGQVKANLTHVPNTTDGDYPRSLVELPSGNLLFFSTNDEDIHVIKTDQYLHVLESHSLTETGMRGEKVKLIGDDIYLIGEYGSVAVIGFGILKVDTNGYVVKSLRMPNIIPDYMNMFPMDLFLLDDNHVGIVTTNIEALGGISILKIPTDLNISIGRFDLVPSLPEYIDIKDITANRVNNGLFSLSYVQRVYDDSLKIHSVSIEYAENAVLRNHTHWIVPNISPVFSYEGALSSYIHSNSPITFYGNKRYGVINAFGNNPFPVSGKIFPDGYYITDVNHNYIDGLFFNMSKSHNERFIGSLGISNSSCDIYENGLITNANMKDGSWVGYSYSGELQAEKFKLSDINICRDLVTSFEYEQLGIPYSVDTLITLQPHDVVSFNSNLTSWEPYSVNVEYICDPNHLSIGKNETISLDIFPSPASNFVNVKTEETIISVEILDLTGKVVQRNASANPLISIQNLSDGMYIFRIHTKKGIATKKVMVSK